MLCYVMLCYVMLCYVMLCYVMLCYVILCYVMLIKHYYHFRFAWRTLNIPEIAFCAKRKSFDIDRRLSSQSENGQLHETNASEHSEEKSSSIICS